MRIYLFLILFFEFAGWAQTPNKTNEAGRHTSKDFLWRVQGSNSVVFLLGTLWSTQGPPPVNAKMEEAYTASPIIVVPYTRPATSLIF